MPYHGEDYRLIEKCGELYEAEHEEDLRKTKQYGFDYGPQFVQYGTERDSTVWHIIVEYPILCHAIPYCTTLETQYTRLRMICPSIALV